MLGFSRHVLCAKVISGSGEGWLSVRVSARRKAGTSRHDLRYRD